MEIEKREVGDRGQFVPGTGKPMSGKANRLLQRLNTKISVGTEVYIISLIFCLVLID